MTLAGKKSNGEMSRLGIF